MAGTAILLGDQKIFSMKELKEKGFSQYKVSKLVDEGDYSVAAEPPVLLK